MITCLAPPYQRLMNLRKTEKFKLTLQVSGSLVNGGEDAGGFDDVFGASGSPLNLGRVSVVEDGDGLRFLLEAVRESW